MAREVEAGSESRPAVPDEAASLPRMLDADADLAGRRGEAWASRAIRRTLCVLGDLTASEGADHEQPATMIAAAPAAVEKPSVLRLGISRCDLV
jgi:hypothetical protein